MPRRQGLTGRRVSIVAAVKHRLNRLNETQEEKDKRLGVQREYSRRRRSLETKEDKAQRLALDTQRRKRKRQQEMRLQISSDGQNVPLGNGAATSRRPRSGSTGLVSSGFITRAPGGILEPEISLVNSYNPGFMKFMLSIHGEAVAQVPSLATGEDADLGPSQLSRGTSKVAAVENSGINPKPVCPIMQTCKYFENFAEM